jgi:hypothetical protein
MLKKIIEILFSNSKTLPSKDNTEITSVKKHNTSNIERKNVFTTSEKDSSKQKGDLFENYIIGKFDKRYFTLKDMRSDKGIDGFYPESNQYPDLLLEYRPSASLFAVECKWRQNWWIRNGNKEEIDWAGGDKKIENYNSYSNKNAVPVFVVIGISGEPNNPKEIFVVPLKALKYRYVEKSYLKKFEKKDTTKNFFFDSKKIVLK